MTHPWTFGWDALVALGTLSLALVTGWLAWTTRRVATADLASLRAQWRPMLVPHDRPAFTPNSKTGHWTGEIRIKNSGRGPALYIRATLDPENVSPDPWSLGAIGPEDQRALVFSNLPNRQPSYQLLLDYRDVSGRLYSSAIVIDFPEGDQAAPGRYYDVNLFEDHAVTTLGDSVPSSYLRRVGPEPRRSIGKRILSAISGSAHGAREASVNGSPRPHWLRPCV